MAQRWTALRVQLGVLRQEVHAVRRASEAQEDPHRGEEVPVSGVQQEVHEIGSPGKCYMHSLANGHLLKALYFPHSVTRCWNKKKPMFASKICQRELTQQFLPKCDFFQNSLQSHQMFCLILKENLSPRFFKNSPIWSHCLSYAYVQRNILGYKNCCSN